MKNLLFLIADTDSHVTTESLLSYLTPSRLQKAMRYKKESDRRMCAFGELLLFHALRMVGAPQTDVIWDGKPHLVGEKYLFSLSHTKNQLALFLADTPCGIDIEIPYEPKQKEALCARLFCEKEKAVLHTNEDFFLLWTAKEAFVKYTGEGFSRPFSSFYVDFATSAVYDLSTNKQLACITPFTAFENTVGCICTADISYFEQINVTAKDLLTKEALL